MLYQDAGDRNLHDTAILSGSPAQPTSFLQLQFAQVKTGAYTICPVCRKWVNKSDIAITAPYWPDDGPICFSYSVCAPCVDNNTVETMMPRINAFFGEALSHA
ncbi:MAG: hypothetical protein R3A44_10310 [Caldilineaceae bacterium]